MPLPAVPLWIVGGILAPSTDPFLRMHARHRQTENNGKDVEPAARGLETVLPLSGMSLYVQWGPTPMGKGLHK